MDSTYGCPYYRYLHQIHQLLKPEAYVEIGVHKGESLLLASAQTLAIGIDPQPGDIPETSMRKLYRMTSDDFFAGNNLQELLESRSLDLCFIDGMHLFEYALRDFINLEKSASSSTMLLFHDCIPPNSIISARERFYGDWTGDVWKVVPCLLEYRPDLNISLIDVQPSGLAVVSGLNPSNTQLADNMNEILEKYIQMNYSHFLLLWEKLKSLVYNLDTTIRIHKRRDMSLCAALA